MLLPPQWQPTIPPSNTNVLVPLTANTPWLTPTLSPSPPYGQCVKPHLILVPQARRLPCIQHTNVGTDASTNIKCKCIHISESSSSVITQGFTMQPLPLPVWRRLALASSKRRKTSNLLEITNCMHKLVNFFSLFFLPGAASN